MKIFSFLLYLLMATSLLAQQKPSQQWLDHKYSMFIHFGLYSLYGGVYDGKPVKQGYSEQIQSFAGIFSDWYARSTDDFNPLQWNPDSIVMLAKEAGMRSIVFTSKHHDGFCMYHSAHTDFNIVDATPYGRDLMRELADACARGGIGFGVYFSLIDWHYPQAYPISSHNADPLTPEHYEFNRKQVEEIMTYYGPLSEIWFDMGALTIEQSRGLYALVDSLQPQCMISGRLGNDYVDFSVMADNEYPDYKMTLPWQTAASMFNETWGYRSWQERGQVQPKLEEKIRSLVQVVSRGGNFLLNIGPCGNGSVVEFEKEVLRGIGRWLKLNEEAIYGAHANPFRQSFAWGDVTSKDNDLFAFVTKPMLPPKINLSGFDGMVKEVTLLSSGEALPFLQNKSGMEIDLSGISSNEMVPVIKITFHEGYHITPTSIVTNGKLYSYNATPLFGHSSINYYGGYKSLIGYEWLVRLHNNIRSSQIFFTENEKGREVELDINGDVRSYTLDSEVFETVKFPSRDVKWGDLYRKKGKGVFGYVDEESAQTVERVAAGSGWKTVTDFQYGEVYTERIAPRSSFLLLQEIASTSANTIAVKIKSSNAVYILLNGVYITAHFSPERIQRQEEIVLLPLKEGRNQLIIKFYNGFEKELTYGITPLEEWKVYKQTLDPVSLPKRGDYRIGIRAADSPSAVSPMRLNNIGIVFR